MVHFGMFVGALCIFLAIGAGVGVLAFLALGLNKR